MYSRMRRSESPSFRKSAMVPSGALSFLIQRVAVDHVQRLRDSRVARRAPPASHMMRAGRPKDARNSDFTCVSGNCSARVPAG